jgi:hypothetical protein
MRKRKESGVVVPAYIFGSGDVHADPANLEGMGRFDINTENALGIRVTSLRKLANTILMVDALQHAG